jgi:hypothetical protein
VKAIKNKGAILFISVLIPIFEKYKFEIRDTTVESYEKLFVKNFKLFNPISNQTTASFSTIAYLALPYSIPRLILYEKLKSLQV